ncbi:MAG: hypothetical protein HZC37_00115 [Burkholderiales bacterium]|nr:hypothetical protein [Burkholderiales bacterium]
MIQVHIDGSRRPRPPAQRIVFCDGATEGALGAGDLELSHWIPNRTPARWKADTSTEICLNHVADRAAEAAEAARGEAAERYDLAVNNHVDVDGVLSLWVLAHGEAALAHRRTLVQTAEIGDFHGWGEPAAQALYEALVHAMQQGTRESLDANDVVERCFARIDAVLAGAPVPEAAPGLAAMAAALARLQSGEVVRHLRGERLVHYSVPAALAEADLAQALAVARFNVSLAEASLVPPQARAQGDGGRDGQRLQLLSYETRTGWYHDLWLPGYAWAETPHRWRPPGLGDGGDSNVHRYANAPLDTAARDLGRDERHPGRWAVATTLTPFKALPERAFPIVLSFLREGRPEPSSLSADVVGARLEAAFADLR